MEDDLIFLEYGRRPQVLSKMEDGLNFVGKMEDDLTILANWKTTSIFWQNGRQPQL